LIGFLLIGLWLSSIFLRPVWAPGPSAGTTNLFALTKVGIHPASCLDREMADSRSWLLAGDQPESASR
jgi:hypothetical protein